MPVQPSDYKLVATQLFDVGALTPTKSEACNRTVAGRAYYAAFLSARAAVRSAFGNKNASIAHEPFIDFLVKTKGDTTLSRVGVALRELYFHRVRSDYFQQETVTRANAEACVMDALDVIDGEADLAAALSRYASSQPSLNWMRQDEDVAGLSLRFPGVV